LEDSSVINEKILSDADKVAFENRYNLCYSVAKWLGNFYVSNKHTVTVELPNFWGDFPFLRVLEETYETPYSFS